MYFKYVAMENFLSFRAQTIDLTGTGLVLIEGRNHDDGGSNGSGKSGAIGDALAFALFGQTIRGLKGDEVINRKGLRNCVVSVGFDIGARSYAVRRHRKHSGVDNAGNKLGDRLIVEIDGSPVEQGTTALTQEWLLDQLNIDFETFKCTIVFGQNDTFNFVNETDKRQKEILSKIRRVDLSLSLENIKQGIKERTEELIEVEKSIAVLESHVIEDPGKAFLRASGDWEMSRSAKLKRLKERVQETKKHLAEVPKPETKLESLEQAKSHLKERRSESRLSLVDLREKNQKVSEKIGYSEGRLKKLTSLDNTCPTCEQPVDAAKTSALIQTETESHQKLKRLRDRVEKATCDMEKSDEQNQEHLTNIEASIRSWDEYEKRVSRYNIDVVDFEKEIIEVSREPNPYVVKIRESKEKQRRLSKELEEARSKKAQIEQVLPYLRFWEKGFGDKGIKSFLFDSLCGNLNSRTNHYLNILTGGSVAVRFDTQSVTKAGDVRERFGCTVLSGADTVPYKAYSGGERTRISMAVDLALVDLMTDFHGTKFSLIVHDEQDVYLDAEGRKLYLELLREQSRSKKVFVVAHDAEFRGSFDEVMTVEKREGISQVVDAN